MFGGFPFGARATSHVFSECFADHLGTVGVPLGTAPDSAIVAGFVAFGAVDLPSDSIDLSQRRFIDRNRNSFHI